MTGEGLTEGVAGSLVVVDVANAPSWEDSAVLAFFEAAGRNLLAAEADAGVRHHVALSVVGTDRLLASGYFRREDGPENSDQGSKVPYTIVRATQFFEFAGGIAQSASATGKWSVCRPAQMQPIVSDGCRCGGVPRDVAVADPLNRTVDLAGPEKIRMDDLVRQFWAAGRDAREVICTDLTNPVFRRSAE